MGEGVGGVGGLLIRGRGGFGKGGKEEVTGEGDEGG